MNNMGWKVPAPLVAVLFLALPACGGDVESAADRGESERFEMTEPGTAPPAREAPRTERRESPPPARDEEPAAQEEERISPPDRPHDTEPLTPADPPAVEADDSDALMVEAGSTFHLGLETTLSTESHRAGDVFHAAVLEEVLAPDGMILIPEGATVQGRVTESRESAGSDDEAVLEIQLESLILDGISYPLAASVTATELHTEARDSGSRTAAKIATGTAAGAMVGRILGGSRRSTVTGAAAGAAAGTAVALATQDGHAVLQEGSILVVRLDEGVVLATH